MMQQQQVINFLNEVAQQFPQAISLAAGRPNPQFYQPKDWPRYQQLFVEHVAARDGICVERAWLQLCEYGPSAGIINDLVARYLVNDEGIDANPDALLITNGFQEAVALYCLQYLTADNDVIITLDPSYIGLSAMVAALGKKVIGISVDSVCTDVDFNDFDWQGLKRQVNQLQAQGLRVKAFYINPDFNNPLSFNLSVAARQALLVVCAELDIDIIEDSTYSRFHYGSEAKRPSLYVLDTQQRVFYCGSFAKLFCPGVRVGFLLLPKGRSSLQIDCVALKSLLSVNTSALSQAVIGGWLLVNDCRLQSYLAPILNQYKAQRDVLEAAIYQHLAPIEGVSFFIPDGGFFAQVTLPFTITSDDVFECASQWQLICMPVSFFSLNPENWQQRIRLSFSYYQGAELEQGVARFAAYIQARLAENSNQSTK